MSKLEHLIQTAVSAPPGRMEAALDVLLGRAVAVEPGVQVPVYEPLLTQRETARRLGVSVPTFWRWRVPGQALGGRRRYRMSEVTDYLESEAFERRNAALRAERRLSAKDASGHRRPKPTNTQT